MKVALRDEKGQFVRQFKIWDGSDWDDGYIDSDGRFRVYRPDYPRVYARGHALRSHVVWWLSNRDVHWGELHHVNGNRLDDHLENLLPMANSAHQKLHKVNDVFFNCNVCELNFVVPMWRVNERKREGREIKYCSQKCYQRSRK